jgi:hypothetical protein
MIDYLAERYDLSREDAYLLSSLAVDLKISEVVDGGQYIISALLPEAIFSSRGSEVEAVFPQCSLAASRGRPRLGSARRWAAASRARA